MDVFEVSNLNRQVFATLPEMGRPKTEVAARRLRDIHPAIELTTYGAEWVEQLDRILPRCRVVVNGMDDLLAGLRLYRKAREHGATVIDAYTSPLPSVTRVAPTDPRPEERLGWPTAGVPLERITPAMLDACRRREVEFVLTHSSSIEVVDLALAAEMIAGKRKRFSFAPMVIATGALMAGEAIAALLDRPTRTGCAGYFFNPARARIERPRPSWLVWPRALMVRRFLARMSG